VNATQSKPSIVFCHGIWADGSSFSKVIPALQAGDRAIKKVRDAVRANEILAGQSQKSRRT
jgi:hypothetical protein